MIYDLGWNVFMTLRLVESLLATHILRSSSYYIGILEITNNLSITVILFSDFHVDNNILCNKISSYLLPCFFGWRLICAAATSKAHSRHTEKPASKAR